jgi:fatty-acyl-CoA synthase
VEETIFRMPQVSEVAVVGLPHPYWIEAVTAIVVVKPGQALAEADVVAYCQAQLAHFKVPKKVVFTETLPRNPSGKLLKRELRAAYEKLLEKA